jgi:hypothetical protein
VCRTEQFSSRFAHDLGKNGVFDGRFLAVCKAGQKRGQKIPKIPVKTLAQRGVLATLKGPSETTFFAP